MVLCFGHKLPQLPKGNKGKAYHGCAMPTGQPFRPKKESPVERIILGLPDMAISKVVSLSPCILEVRWEDETRCPHCDGEDLRVKDLFWREIKSYRVAVNPVRLRIRCHKFRRERCGRYFNTQLPAVRMCSLARIRANLVPTSLASLMIYAKRPICRKISALCMVCDIPSPHGWPAPARFPCTNSRS